MKRRTGLIAFIMLGICIYSPSVRADEESLDSFLGKLNDPQRANAADTLKAIRRLIKETIELRRQLNLRVAPVGTIVAFGGGTIPQGWHLCDGSPIDRTKQKDFEALFRAIGYSWGGSGDRFQLPDLQGMFLRGVAHQATSDPDRELRKPAVAGTPPNAVGSTQPFSTARPASAPFVTSGQSQTHSHPVNGGNSTNHRGNDASRGHDMGMNNSFSIGNADRDHTHTVTEGGDRETRPINAYVEFIIKYVDQ